MPMPSIFPAPDGQSNRRYSLATVDSSVYPVSEGTRSRVSEAGRPKRRWSTLKTYAFNSAVTKRPLHRFHFLFSIRFFLAAVPAIFLLTTAITCWAITHYYSSQEIDRLAQEIRTDTIQLIQVRVLQRLKVLYDLATADVAFWNRTRFPRTSAEVQEISRRHYCHLEQHDHLVASPYLLIEPNQTILFHVLVKLPTGYVVDSQNSTHGHRMRAFNTVLGEPAEVVMELPRMDLAHAGFGPPVSELKPGEFTWFGVYNAGIGSGDMLEGLRGVFDENHVLVGRTGSSMSTLVMREMVKELVQRDSLEGSRLVIYQPDGFVLASSHGKFDLNTRFLLTEIGDPDIEAAAAKSFETTQTVCTPLQSVYELSREYFVDISTIDDPHPSLKPLDLCVMLLVPRDNTLGKVDVASRYTAMLIAALLIVVLLCSGLFAHRITQPLMDLASGMQDLVTLNTDGHTIGQSNLYELCATQQSYLVLREALQAFAKYLPHSVVMGLLDNRITAELGMKKCGVTVMFMDLENFTTLCDQSSAAEIVKTTGPLFQKMTDIILHHQGTLDKYIGDCIMAFWGAPAALPEPCQTAFDAVMEIQSNQKTSSATATPLRFRIGLHAGTVLVGNFGATQRFDFTCVGDAVNLAARLEPLNKEFGTSALCSERVYDELHAESKEKCRRMGSTLLIGKKDPIGVYEVGMGISAKHLLAWEQALRAYEVGDFATVATLLAPFDDKSALKLVRESEYLHLHPPEVWDGVRVMRSK
eukprot:NODE_309_length_2445_cov_70.848576_g287_i0.p1 GENE.NODE_309_length_2445_cov_70.848576_g287_i0~~NODE_309_length_2445_cov_70.848576_g287_i0.p1  ORF type:complete len:761 (-),score=187.52 NODE_309_length_2445_cov_70.848576_g287_i0:163-2421(-)